MISFDMPRRRLVLNMGRNDGLSVPGRVLPLRQQARSLSDRRSWRLLRVFFSHDSDCLIPTLLLATLDRRS